MERNLLEANWRWLRSSGDGTGHWYQQSQDPRRIPLNSTASTLTLGSLTFEKVYHLFVDDLFSAVQIHLASTISLKDVMDTFIPLWGTPSITKEDEKFIEHVWKGSTTNIYTYAPQKSNETPPGPIILALAEAKRDNALTDYKDLTEEEKKIIALKNDL